MSFADAVKFTDVLFTPKSRIYLILSSIFLPDYSSDGDEGEPLCYKHDVAIAFRFRLKPSQLLQSTKSIRKKVHILISKVIR